MPYNPYREDLDVFIDLAELEGIDVTVVRENADYFVLDLEGDIYDFRDIEWCVEDSGGRTIHFKLYEDGYATLTIGF